MGPLSRIFFPIMLIMKVILPQIFSIIISACIDLHHIPFSILIPCSLSRIHHILPVLQLVDVSSELLSSNYSDTFLIQDHPARKKKFSSLAII